MVDKTQGVVHGQGGRGQANGGGGERRGVEMERDG